MNNLTTLILVGLSAAGFSTSGIAASDHDSHDAMHAQAAAETVKKTDKSADKIPVPQGASPNSKINADHSGPASPEGHAHEHAANK